MVNGSVMEVLKKLNTNSRLTKSINVYLFQIKNNHMAKRIKLNLVGLDGNAFALMGAFKT